MLPFSSRCTLLDVVGRQPGSFAKSASQPIGTWCYIQKNKSIIINSDLLSNLGAGYCTIGIKKNPKFEVGIKVIGVVRG